MSEWRERYDGSPGMARTLEWLESYYQYVVGAVVLLFMLFVRIRDWGNFVVGGEVLFGGNDPWYHYRMTSYTVENWPATMPFDPWTYFPYGNASGQFGTFFDQIMATVAMVVGLGSPSEGLVATVVLLVPVLLGVLIAIPTYVLGRRVGGRFGGVVALIVLALSAGRLLRVALVGFSDHHIAEAFFQVLAVLGVVVAVSVAQRDKPIYEQFLERRIDPIRSTVAWSILAGFAITAYLWVWPPGILIVGVFGVYFLLQLTIEFARGESPEHTAIAGAVTMTTTGITVLGAMDVLEITAVEFSLLQPLLAFAIAAGCVFMAWLARVWEFRDLDRWQYPVSVFGIIAAVVILARVLTPDLYGFFLNNVRRVVGFGTSPAAGTIAETTPIQFSEAGVLFDWYGFAIVIAAGASLFIVGRTLFGRKVRSELLLIVVWFAFMAAATFTQQRFGYYLTVPVAVLTGYAVGFVFSKFDLRFQAGGFELYKGLTVLAIVLLLVVPMAIGSSTALGSSANNGPGQDIQGWTDSLEWMQDNTPVEGRYADDTAELDLYGTYERTDDYDYEAGAYGVLSWWDYGHWITVQGERIPTANPHQQGSNTAANFLLSPNETQANDVVSTVSEDEEAQTRYVMVDWKMASSYNNLGGKFFAPPTFYDLGDASVDDYYTYPGPVFYTIGQGQAYFRLQHQAYYDSMTTRLYQYHGSASEAANFAVTWEPVPDQSGDRAGTGGLNDGALQPFNSTEEAREFVENGTNATTQASVGGIGPYPSERVPALENYRFVGSSERSALSSQAYTRSLLYSALGTGLGVEPVSGPGECDTNLVVNRPTEGESYACLTSDGIDQHHRTSPAWTKIFERVPGATVEGTGPADANVTAVVTMRNEVTGDDFTYHQRAETDSSGEFTMTIPYSTTGYDEWGPEQGRTNVSVRSTGPMEFSTVTEEDGTGTMWRATTEIPEGAVIGERDEAVTVDLEQVEDVPEGQEVLENGTESG